MSAQDQADLTPYAGLTVAEFDALNATEQEATDAWRRAHQRLSERKVESHCPECPKTIAGCERCERRASWDIEAEMLGVLQAILDLPAHRTRGLGGLRADVTAVVSKAKGWAP